MSQIKNESPSMDDIDNEALKAYDDVAAEPLIDGENQAESVPNGDADQQQLIDSLNAQLKQQQNDHLLQRAEMDNLRKRNARELEKARKFALERLLNELVPVLDSLEQGMQAAKQSDVSVEQLSEGTAMTLNLFTKALEKHGVVSLDPLGETFDPQVHEAMSMVESSDYASNTVTTVFQKGYLLNERLLRPARVIVAK